MNYKTNTILSGKVILFEADEKQRNNLNNIWNFNDKARSKLKRMRRKKVYLWKYKYCL